MCDPRIIGDHYKIIGKLGSGGFAIVYLVRDNRTGSLYAMKMLKSDFLQDSTISARFQREAQILRRIQDFNDPHVVHMIESGEDQRGTQTVPFIVMEYIDGHPL